MNKTEHLLTCLVEECVEVQHAVAKSLRFGLDYGHPERITTNAQDISRECCDLVAIIEILEAEGIISKAESIQKMSKKVKVRQFMDIAKECRALSE